MFLSMWLLHRNLELSGKFLLIELIKACYPSVINAISEKLKVLILKLILDLRKMRFHFLNSAILFNVP